MLRRVFACAALFAVTAAVGAPRAGAADAAGGWLPLSQRAAAVEQAKKLRRPLAILWSGDNAQHPVVKDWIAQWKKSDLPKRFVCIEVVSATANNQITLTDLFHLQVIKTSGINMGAVRLPYLLFANTDGQCYGYIEATTTAPNAVTIVQGVLDRHAKAVGAASQPPQPAQPAQPAEPAKPQQPERPAGPMVAQLPPQVLQTLASARALWADGKFDEAMSRYRWLVNAAREAPKSALPAELKKDAVAINQHGDEELKKARQLAVDKKFEEAVAEIRRIHSVYNGFKTAAQAKALFEKVQRAHQQHVAAQQQPQQQQAANQPKNAAQPPAANPPADQAKATKLPKGKGLWFPADKREEAFKRAAMLGRPIVLVWYMSGQNDRQLSRLMNMPELAKYFVGIAMPAAMQGRTIHLNDPLLQQMFSTSGIQGGLMMPYAFLGTAGGQCYSYFQGDANTEQIKTAVRDAVKKYGRIPPARKALTAWKRLQAARKLWAEKKFDEALANYRSVFTLREINPNLPILAELNKDFSSVDGRGAQELEEAHTLLDNNKLDEAETKVRDIYHKYQGFDTAKGAKELYQKIKLALKERAVARKEVDQAGPDEPAVDDKALDVEDRPVDSEDKPKDETKTEDKNAKDEPDEDDGSEPGEFLDDF